MASVLAYVLEDESIAPHGSFLVDKNGLQSGLNASMLHEFIICLSLSLGASEHVTLRCGSDINLCHSGDVIDDGTEMYLVASPWVLNSLGCSHGDSVCITQATPVQDVKAYPMVEKQDSDIDGNTNVETKVYMTLTFVRNIPLQKYNGYLDASDSIWPQGLYAATITKMLPSLLCMSGSNDNQGNGMLLSHNAIIPLTILDNEMLFRISVSTSENESIDTSIIYYFNMDVFTNRRQLNNRNRLQERHALITKYFVVCSSPSETLKSPSITASMKPENLPALSPTSSMNLLLRKVLSFYRSLNVSNKTVFRSIAISGPIGSGKSFLMEHLRDTLCCLGGDRQEPVVLNVHCDATNGAINDVDHGNSAESMHSFDLCASYDDEGSVNKYIYTLLEKLMLYTATSSTDLHRAQRSGKPLVILLEEVDFVYSSDEDLSAFIAETRSSKSLRRMRSHSRGANSDGNAAANNEDNNRDYTESEERQFQRQSLLASILTPLLSTLRHPRCSLPIILYATSVLPYRALLSVPSQCPAFEKVVVIPKPSATDRRLLIDVMITDQGNSDEGVSYVLQEGCLEGAVGLSAGYLPGDLYQVICRAISLQKGISNATNRESSIDSTEVTLSWQCFRHAIASTIPLSLLSMGQGVNNRQWDVSGMDEEDGVWDRFAGYNQQKKGLQDRLALLCSGNGDNSKNDDALRSSLHVQNAGIVLHGPSGCGKTYLASLLPAITNMNSITIQATSLLSKYYGETEANVRNLFERARSAAPCLLFFDEFDALAHRRGHEEGEDHSVHNRILSTFLNEMDGILGNSNNSMEGDTNINEDTVLVVVACSALEVLDEALIRPGRLSLHVHLNHPTEEDVRDIMTYYLQHVPLDSAVTIPALMDKIRSKYRFRVADDNGKNIFGATFTTTAPINLQSFSFSLPYITCAQIKDICSQAVTQAVGAFLHKHVSSSAEIHDNGNNGNNGEVNEEDLVPLLANTTVQLTHFEAVLANK